MSDVLMTDIFYIIVQIIGPCACYGCFYLQFAAKI